MDSEAVPGLSPDNQKSIGSTQILLEVMLSLAFGEQKDQRKQ